VDKCKPLEDGGDGGEDGVDYDGLGRTVQVDPLKPKLKPPGTRRLKLKCDTLLSTSAFKFYLRRYTWARSRASSAAAASRTSTSARSGTVGWCRLTL